MKTQHLTLLVGSRERERESAAGRQKVTGVENGGEQRADMGREQENSSSDLSQFHQGQGDFRIEMYVSNLSIMYQWRFFFPPKRHYSKV